MPTSSEPTIYYYGCWGELGHYMHRPGCSWKKEHALLHQQPWGPSVDGGLCSGHSGSREGRARVHHKDGWTALAFWDRSLDRRPGSNSVFLAEGTHDFAAMCALAARHFSEVWDRLPFPIIEVTDADE